MNDSLFWQDGFPKERRVELVANLLYAKDPNARIPNNEGLRPERVDDFYATVGFSSIGDFEDRMDAVWAKYRYGESPAETEAPKLKERRPRAPRVTLPEQLAPRSSKSEVGPIVPVPALRIDLVAEPPVVETPIIAVIPPTPDVRRPTADLHPEDRVSAFARSALAWFGRKPQAAHGAESATDDAVDSARMREVVAAVCSKEIGANAFQEDVHADPKARAHLQAANRLERAIATSARLDARVRESMNERLGALRTAYQDRMGETARAQSEELQGGLDAVAVAQERSGAHSALRVLAGRRAHIADDLVAFREQVEHAALQRGGMETVTAIDAAFQDAWQEAWKGSMIPADIGPLEESLPRLRQLEESSRSGITRVIAQARLSIQEEVDRRLPAVEREMKRAA